MESLGEFASLISGTICPASPFDLLPPPTTVGFLKMSRPCCYVFPAGRGDCAFFAVNGFTVLVDGGSDSQACFWKLVRHLDRVDAVLLTHVGTENLPGAISFLERKVAEQELRCKVRDDLSKRLISPELGVVFFNAPSKLKEEQHSFADNVLKSTQQAAITLKLLKKLDIRPQPMFRPQVVPIKPITLFQKMGVGQLDLYILTPGKSSQEYEMFMQNWPDGVTSQSFPLPALVSVSALLVWHPACPQEKLVRVLFPGATPQAKLLQGLEKLKGLDFLQTPTVTTGDLERRAEDKKARRTESLDSGRSIGKEGTAKHGKERGAREEVKDSLMKQKGKTLSGTKETDKTKIKETGIKRKPSLSEKNTLKKGLGKDGKKEDRPGNKEESSVKRTEQIKRDTVSSKTKKENKTKPKKEARNDKTGEKKTQKSSNKEANNDKKALANNRPTEQKQASLSKIAEPEFPDSGEQNHKKETEGEEKQQNSKMSTPEDITADFLQLRMESELDVAKPVRTACGNLGHATNLGGFRETACNEKVERFIVEGAGCLEKVKVEGGDNLVQKSAKAEADLLRNPLDESIKSRKPAKVGGFPTPLNKSYRSDQTDQLDTTPTEYTLLDGALKHSPPSRSSPENQGTNSPEEETAEPVSPDSRPNSAGHTPYCLSPDDVWCNRATLSRLKALDSGDTFEANGSSWQSEDRAHKTKGATENPKEKQLCFLSLGTCKEGSSDHSPSVATTTTTTTHSLPAEVSSPQSTEVDESLSMSFEQGPTVGSQKEGDDGVYLSHSNGEYHVGKSLPVKKPPRSLGQNSEMGRPAAPNTLPFEGSAHNVDLCLVSPCEFKHFKTPNSSSGTSEASREVSGSNHQGNNNNNPKDRSPSESNAPVCTEDYPSTTADGALDSDSDDSCSDPSNSPCNHDTSQTLPPDPLPAPLRDSPPLPPHPDTSMPVPQSDSEAHGKKAKTTATRGKKFPPIIDSPPIGNVKMGSQSGAVKRNLTTNRTLLSSTRSTPAKSSPAPSSKAPSAGEVSIYVDLTYIPSGASCPTVTVDFFKCIRSSCYIISGNTPEREELMSEMLDALLDGKTSWPEIMQVTVIPTFESVSMQEWYQQTLERQRELSITVLGSNSTVAMQDETFPACKIEF